MDISVLEQKKLQVILILSILLCLVTTGLAQQKNLILNEQEYFEMPGLNVMVFHDYYPEGHQGGVTIIQNGVRVASNGDLRLEPAPGQWQPVPKVGERSVDLDNHTVSVPCFYPNPDKNRKGFNPIIYPDLNFKYTVNVKAEGSSIRITVDIDEELPAEWIGKVGFNLELFPGVLFGKTYYMDDKAGLFPRQLNGPMIRDEERNFQIEPLAEGKKLVIVPECDNQRMVITAQKEKLQLIDGRAHHNNGWFIVRTPVPKGATKGAVEWVVSPNVLPDWKYEPVIHLSQVGYHPHQRKVAIIECDPRHKVRHKVFLKRILPSGELKTILSDVPEHWGKFLRYQYYLFDFSDIWEYGMYVIIHGDSKSQPFKIGEDVFDRHVWQPALEYFLPVQMCHMRVNDRYRVWHGLCHMDDALMAPVDTLHFDGYRQGDSTLTSYKPSEPVPGLNVGGWHDAGDYDLRVESQAGTVRILSLAYEAFHVQYDETTIDQQNHLVELHRPDGKPDILQQIEHGVLTILAGYKNLGRLYRGIVCPDLRQYVLLGDGSTMTDNRVYNPNLSEYQIIQNESGKSDDRWVFTEKIPRREFFVASCLAAASRVLRDYNITLANECLQVAEELLSENKDIERHSVSKIETLAELVITTNKPIYKNQLIRMLPEIQKQIHRIGWVLGRVFPFVDDSKFNQSVTDAVRSHSQKLVELIKENPFGVPYRPHIWGAGWEIQQFGIQQYYLHAGWPNIVSKEHVLNALNFILGCHPGPNTASFVSGVGSKSVTVAYGVNRADWSYIPGGVASGTAFIRPDFPELKEWPFLWQQTEYVIGGGASNFMFLVLAAKQLMEFETENQKLIDEIDASLKSKLLNVWYPTSIDTVNGGFLSDFTYAWQPDGRQNKMLVTQTRHIWTTSSAAIFYNEDNYRKIAEHGFQFLKDKMWDKTYGGFYMLRDRKGDSIQGSIYKSAYGNAFAIYALATYYAMSGDTAALHLAQETFLWLDEHSRDPEYKGYFDRLTRDGSWSGRGRWKDQNSSIHLLEAFTELYRVWPDSLLRERLLEMLVLIRDTIVTDEGYLTLFLERDWTPVSFRDSSDAVRKANYNFDHVSFGHDVETAYLMLETSHALGIEFNTKTLMVAKKMVDHALAKGWDDENGGFYYQGYYFNNTDTISIISDVKTWWVQAEGLNALLLMAKLFPDEKKYYDAFKKQWEYINKYLIDHEHGGWYIEGLDRSPDRQKAPKAFDWKINYHSMRGLMSCIKMLKSVHGLIK